MPPVGLRKEKRPLRPGLSVEISHCVMMTDQIKTDGSVGVVDDMDHGRDAGTAGAQTEIWKPNRHEFGVMLTLSLTSLLVSLDATIIVTSLSVSHCPSPKSASHRRY